jgi:hypothetical protein
VNTAVQGTSGREAIRLQPSSYGNPVRRVAVIAYHSSPLVDPGSDDAGGMTVYLRELAAASARLGLHTDIFTRATGAQPRLTELGDLVRVVANRLRHRFSEVALQAARAFSWDATAAAVRGLYDCLVMERLPDACTC